MICRKNHPIKVNFPDADLPNDNIRLGHKILTLENVHHHFKAKLPLKTIEVVKLFKNVKNSVFEVILFLEISQDGKFAAECVSKDDFSEKSFFQLYCDILGRKIRNYFDSRKNRKDDKE